MACFLVPMGEAIVTTIIQKRMEKREKKGEKERTVQTGLSWNKKLSWLNQLLWGGSILLALEHVWHGEVTFWPPFLTAMKNPAEIGPMLHEMATIGGAMAVFVTLVWIIMIHFVEKKIKVPSNLKVGTLNGGVK